MFLRPWRRRRRPQQRWPRRYSSSATLVLEKKQSTTTRASWRSPRRRRMSARPRLRHLTEGSWDEQTTVLLKNEHLCGPAKSTGWYWYRSVPVHIWPFIPVWVERLYLITIVLMVVNGLHGQVANYKRKGREKIQRRGMQGSPRTEQARLVMYMEQLRMKSWSGGLRIFSTNCQPDEFTQHDECEGR
uniref:Uncharacterized protein n=1 Tax=Oryza nivara TaxID=4536 RepID=A0A0E0FI56_ORYNI